MHRLFPTGWPERPSQLSAERELRLQLSYRRQARLKAGENNTMVEGPKYGSYRLKLVSSLSLLKVHSCISTSRHQCNESTHLRQRILITRRSSESCKGGRFIYDLIIRTCKDLTLPMTGSNSPASAFAVRSTPNLGVQLASDQHE